MLTEWYFFICCLWYFLCKQKYQQFGQRFVWVVSVPVLFEMVLSILTSFQYCNFQRKKTWNFLSLHGKGTHFKTTTENNGEITSPHSHEVQRKIPEFVSKLSFDWQLHLKFPNSKQSYEIYSEYRKSSVKIFAKCTITNRMWFRVVCTHMDKYASSQWSKYCGLHVQQILTNVMMRTHC